MKVLFVNAQECLSLHHKYTQGLKGQAGYR